MGTSIGVLHAVFQTSITLDHFFTPNYIDMTTTEGWAEAGCIWISSLVGYEINFSLFHSLFPYYSSAWLLSIIVEKSKKCVDFTFTLFFIHTVVCTSYESFPLNWEWWLVHVIASVIMASLGEYLCAQKEMEDIPLYTPDGHANSERNE